MLSYVQVEFKRASFFIKQIIESRQKTQDEGVGNACDAVRVSVLVLSIETSVFVLLIYNMLVCVSSLFFLIVEFGGSSWF